MGPARCDVALTVNGASKNDEGTGWGSGYAGGPAPLIKAIAKIQSQSASNPCSIAQAAVVAARCKPGPAEHRKGANVAQLRPQGPAVLGEARDVVLGLDLMQNPQLAENGRVRGVLGALTPVVRVSGLSTEGGFLVLQLRQNSAIQRVTIHTERTALVQELTISTFDGELIERRLPGNAADQTLDAIQCQRYLACSLATFRLLEEVFDQHRDGLIGHAR